MGDKDYCPDFVKSLDRDEVRRFYHYNSEPPADCASIGYGNLKPLESYQAILPTDYLVPRYFVGSDYSGGSVTESNHRVFMREHGDDEGVHEVHGSYGTYAVAIRLDALTPEQWEAICATESYPLLDENDHSELEMEQQNEAWENDIRDDFKRALVKRADEEDQEDVEALLDTFADGELFSLFHDACEAANEYWTDQQGAGQWINVERVAKAVTVVRDENDREIGFEYERWTSGGKNPHVHWHSEYLADHPPEEKTAE